MAKKSKKFIPAPIIIMLLLLLLTAFLVILGSDKLPRDTNVLAGNVVTVSPGQSIQSAINSNPAGTTYILEAGIHRMQKFYPKDGDTIEGEYGAILNGSKLLDAGSFVQSGNTWYITGQTQESLAQPGSLPPGGSGTGSACKSTFPRCDRNEEVFINDVRVKHVSTLQDVTAGTFYFDYAADRIYIGDNPSGKKIEASVTDFAVVIWGESNVTFRNIIVEKYATPAQRSTVEINGENNIIEFSEFRLNHSTGVSVGSYGIMRNNYIHRNGQKGFGGRNDSFYTMVENNEVSYNNEAGFELTYDAGGNKFANTSYATYKNNYIHHNDGPGLWTDIDNVNTTYDGNIIVYNSKHGIQHEISFDAVVKNNFVAYNGQSNAGGSQIFIQISNNVSVFDNTVIVGPSTNSGRGIMIQNNLRGSGQSSKYPGEVWAAYNNQIFDNTIYLEQDRSLVSGLEGFDTSGSYPAPYDFYSATSGTSFDSNTYYVPNASSQRWRWQPFGQSDKSFTQYQAAGQEVNGQVNTYTSSPSIPDWNVARGPQVDGVGSLTYCGDGTAQTPNDNGQTEQCDDGNNINGDGCDNTCQIEVNVDISNWTYRKPIIIESDQVSGSTDLNNFPVLVKISGDTDLASKAQNDFDDIAFTSSDGTTRLDHEIESYNSSTGDLIVWVRVPTLGATADTTIYMYYGEGSVTSQEKPTGVWNNYLGVWHLEEDPSISTDGDCGGGTKEVCDSTSFDGDGDSAGTMTDTDSITGVIGKAINFDGSNDSINIGGDVGNITTNDFTISFWQRTIEDTSGAHVISKGANGGAGYRIYMNPSFDRFGFRLQGTASIDTTPGSYTPLANSGSWQYVTWTFDRSGVATVFVNGTQKFTTSISSLDGQSLTNVDTLYIGRAGFGQYWDGDLDEVRLYDGLKTLEYVTTEYNNQNSNGTFFTIGTEQDLTPKVCGDGNIDDPNDNSDTEVCDDSNTANNDYCSADCTEVCIAPQIWNGTECFDPTAHSIGADTFTLQAENFNDGGQLVGYFDGSNGNRNGNIYRNTDVDIKAITGGYVVGYMETGDWLEYTVNVPQTAVYDLAVQVASGVDTGILAVNVDGVEIARVNIPNTGNYDTFQTINVPGANIASGSRTIRFTVINQWMDLDYITFNVDSNPVCGDGTPDAGEECDDGNSINTDACTNSCELAICGDEIIRSGSEQCDEGSNNGVACDPAYGSSCSYCSNSCQTTVVNGNFCGDGNVDSGSGEQCDDSNNTSNDGCSSTCQLETCGDGVIQTGEACDNGGSNGQACTATYGNSCDYCSNSCQTVTVEGATCGDGNIDAGAGEQCDNGANNGQVCSATYGNTCNYCGNACQTQTVQGGLCGDGTIDYSNSEQCDDSNSTNGDGCSATCQYEISNPSTQAYCGPVDVNDDDRLTLIDFVNFVGIYGKQCVDTSGYSLGCGGKDRNTDNTISLVDFVNFATRFNQNSCEL